MQLLSFRDLGQAGGPFWYERYPNPNENPYVKAIAGEFEVNDIDNESGDTIKRKAVPADRFPSPYANAIAAAAANGGAPPPRPVGDGQGPPRRRPLHLLAADRLSRHAGRPDRQPDQHYNPWFPGDLTSAWSGDRHHVPPGGVIAMPAPLTSEGQVTYDDGTKPTVDQMSQDVAAFIAWA